MAGIKKVELAMLWVVPIASIGASASYWATRESSSLLYLAYLALVPLAFSLTIVAGAGRLRLWVWSKPLPYAVLVNCGYAMLLYLLTGSTLQRDTTAWTTFEAGAGAGVMYAAIGTLNDVVGIEHKIFTVFNRAHHKGWGAIASALSYGFFYFGALGFAYGTLAKLGHFYLVECEPAWLLYVPVSLAVFLAPYLAWVGYLSVLKKRAASKIPAQNVG